MEILPNTTILVIGAVVEIARSPTSTAPVSIKEIEIRLCLSRRGLETCFQALVRDGVLAAVRGPHGGHMLARSPDKISVGDIVRVCDRLSTAERYDANGAAPLLNAVFETIRARHDRFIRELDQLTVADLVSFAGAAPARMAAE